MNTVVKILFLIVLLILFPIKKAEATELSTGFHPASSIAYFLPTNGWNGDPNNIKIEDNIAFTYAYSAPGNATWIYTHIDFPEIPNYAIIKRINFKLRAKHDGGVNTGGGGTVSIRKTCTTGNQQHVPPTQTMETVFVTKNYTLQGSGDLTIQDINNQTACFIPGGSINTGGINHFDYFAAEVIYEIPEVTPT